MSHSPHNKLVYMANQIGAFFATQGKDDKAVAAAIADHITKFWEPRMRVQILAHLKEHGGEGLDPFPKEAIEMLARAADKKA